MAIVARRNADERISFMGPRARVALRAGERKRAGRGGGKEERVVRSERAKRVHQEEAAVERAGRYGPSIIAYLEGRIRAREKRIRSTQLSVID